MDDLISLVKESLGILEEDTFKDNEIKMWINSAIADMTRQGIDTSLYVSDALIKGCIVMFVKSKFGMTDSDEKAIAENTYKELCKNLSLSDDYKLVED